MRKDIIVYVYRPDTMIWKNTIYIQNSHGVIAFKCTTCFLSTMQTFTIYKVNSSFVERNSNKL